MVDFANAVAPRGRARWLLGSACWSGLSLLAAPGVSFAAPAVESASQSAAQVGEVVVTANRRTEDVTKIPFNVSAYSAQQLERANVTSVTQLSNQVPNFTVQDSGARNSAQSIPIIRGVNASGDTGSAARYFQSPVGYYQGNVPVTGDFPLMDLERVEVLRGPQGTLYGAGALAGAVRIIPSDPRLNQYSGFISAAGSGVDHADKPSYDFVGMVNLPIGDNAAVRIVAKQQYDAGFIDQNDIFRRAGDNYLSGAPVLANPADVANSPGILFNRKDVNETTTTAVRATALWEPTDKLKLEASYSYAQISGDGGPVDNYTYPGGPWPIDPRFTAAPTGHYQISQPTLEPYNRDSQLVSVDGSYDLGFATLSGTFGFGKTDAWNIVDTTGAFIGVGYGVYYVGVPANPRTVVPDENTDVENNYTEELRLVSKEGGPFDYVAGTFFEQQTRTIGVFLYDPGADVQSAAAHGGSTLPIAAGGTYIPLFPDNSSYDQWTWQKFREESVYGDLTWHVTDRFQLTGGARFFHQSFSQHLFEKSSFFFFTVDTNNSTNFSGQTFKANASYQLNDSNQVYATFSQGFRRGGANAFPTAGPIQESPLLLTYQPDKANNFEAGAKGRLGNIRYAADVFYVQWLNPQIDTLTPYNLIYVVINGKEAVSKGFEGEVSGPIGDTGFSFNAGFAYAQARITKNFGLPAGNAAGGFIQNAITGSAGDRLPGSPDFSASATLNYDYHITDGQTLNVSFGADYRSSVAENLPSKSIGLVTAPGYALLRGSIGYETKDWQLELFGTNLANDHIVLSNPQRTQTSLAAIGSWGNSYTVEKPREIGLRLTRRW